MDNLKTQVTLDTERRKQSKRTTKKTKKKSNTDLIKNCCFIYRD